MDDSKFNLLFQYYIMIQNFQNPNLESFMYLQNPNKGNFLKKLLRKNYRSRAY